MLAPARSPEGAVCCIMACWMLPAPPLPSRGRGGWGGSSRGSAGPEGAGRHPSVGPGRGGSRVLPPASPAASGGGAIARRGHRAAAPLTCRPARGPGGAEPPPAPRGGQAAPPSPRPRAAVGDRPALPRPRCATLGGSLHLGGAPAERGEPCPCGWDV